MVPQCLNRLTRSRDRFDNFLPWPAFSTHVLYIQIGIIRFSILHVAGSMHLFRLWIELYFRTLQGMWKYVWIYFVRPLLSLLRHRSLWSMEGRTHEWSGFRMLLWVQIQFQFVVLISFAAWLGWILLLWVQKPLNKPLCNLFLAFFFVITKEVWWKHHFTSWYRCYPRTSSDIFIWFPVLILSAGYVIRDGAGEKRTRIVCYRVIGIVFLHCYISWKLRLDAELLVMTLRVLRSSFRNAMSSRFPNRVFFSSIWTKLIFNFDHIDSRVYIIRILVLW